MNNANPIDALAAEMTGKTLVNKLDGSALWVSAAHRAENTLILVFGMGAATQTMSYTGTAAKIAASIRLDWRQYGLGTLAASF